MSKRKSFFIGNALARGLEETVNAGQNYMGNLRVEVIPLSKIELDPNNPRDLVLTFDDVKNGLKKSDINYTRKEHEKEMLMSIAHSIKEQGIINPIVVYKHHEVYRIIAGERRTLASFIAGKEDIQAKILDGKPDALKLSLLQWIENIEREDLTLWERLKNLENILSAYATSSKLDIDAVTATDLSKLIGCSLPLAMNYKAVMSASEQLKDLIQKNKIKNLEKAAVISKVQDKNLEDELIKMCLNGATLKELKLFAENHQKSKLTASLSKSNKGRPAVRVNLGTTKNLSIAKIIVESVLQNNRYTHLGSEFKTVDWSDYGSVSSAFKKLLKVLDTVK